MNHNNHLKILSMLFRKAAVLFPNRKILFMGIIIGLIDLSFADIGLAADQNVFSQKIEEEKAPTKRLSLMEKEAEARRRLNLAMELNLKGEIPDALRSIFDPTSDEREMREKESLAAGLIRGFNIDGEIYVIWGNHCRGKAKLSVGGSVEITDNTIEDALRRELDEEYFHQLPLSNAHYANEKLYEGGFQIQQDDEGHETISSKGWGPYLTFFALEYGYNLEDLQPAVRIMNINASLHYPVATFFKELESLSPEQIKSQAENFLQEFQVAIDQEGDSIVPLAPEAKKMLGDLVENPEVRPAEGLMMFAKKYIHNYTEYRDFNLTPLKRYIELNIPRFHTDIVEEMAARTLSQLLCQAPSEN